MKTIEILCSFCYIGKRRFQAALDAYFTDGRHIGKKETLLAIATEAGLDSARAQAMLDTDEFAEAVRQDEDEAQLLSLTGVPAFVVNR